MVTAELALASLAIAPLVAALGWVFAVLGLAIQCQGTANEVARQLARGDEAAATRASDAAPDGAAVRTSRSGDRVIVEVSLQASPWVSWLPAVPIELSAATLTEPEGDR